MLTTLPQWLLMLMLTTIAQRLGFVSVATGLVYSNTITKHETTNDYKAISHLLDNAYYYTTCEISSANMGF